jgi:hypothetical protein
MASQSPTQCTNYSVWYIVRVIPHSQKLMLERYSSPWSCNQYSFGDSVLLWLQRIVLATSNVLNRQKHGAKHRCNFTFLPLLYKILIDSIRWHYHWRLTSLNMFQNDFQIVTGSGVFTIFDTKLKICLSNMRREVSDSPFLLLSLE